MGVGSATGRKRQIYAEGGLDIIGDTRIYCIAAADNVITPSDEQLKDDVEIVDDTLCLGIQSHVCEKRN